MKIERPLACVSIVGDDADGARVVGRAIAQRPQARTESQLDFNPPPSFEGAYEVIDTDKRRFVFVASGEDGLAAAPRVFDAAVLVLSAERSVTARTRAFVFELSVTHRGPLIVVITGCESPNGEPDLVEIEARELLDEMGFDADGIACVRTSGLDCAEWMSWLDDHATVSVAPSELPLIARVERQAARGPMQLGLAQGRVERRAKYQALRGSLSIACAFEESSIVTRTASLWGLGLVIARPRQTGLELFDWVVDERAARQVSRVRAAWITTDEWGRGRLGEPLSIDWGSARVDVTLEIDRELSCGSLAMGTVVAEQPFFAIDRAHAVLVDRLDLEPVGRVVFALD